jgi:hypothetical protein
MLADRTLAEVQRVGGSLKAATVRDSHEAAQGRDIQDPEHAPEPNGKS